MSIFLNLIEEIIKKTKITIATDKNIIFETTLAKNVVSNKFTNNKTAANNKNGLLFTIFFIFKIILNFNKSARKYNKN